MEQDGQIFTQNVRLKSDLQARQTLQSNFVSARGESILAPSGTHDDTLPRRADIWNPRAMKTVTLLRLLGEKSQYLPSLLRFCVIGTAVD